MMMSSLSESAASSWIVSEVGLPGGHHDPEDAWLRAERLDHVFQRRRANGSLALDVPDGLRRAVEANDAMLVAQQTEDHVAAHPTEANHANLHDAESRTLLYSARSERSADSMGRWARMHLEQTVHINRPAAEVFDFLLDLDNHPRFAAGIKAVRGVEDGPLALGRRYSQTSTLLGQTIDAASRSSAVSQVASWG